MVHGNGHTVCLSAWSWSIEAGLRRRLQRVWSSLGVARGVLHGAIPQTTHYHLETCAWTHHRITFVTLTLLLNYVTFSCSTC